MPLRAREGGKEDAICHSEPGTRAAGDEESHSSW